MQIQGCRNNGCLEVLTKHEWAFGWRFSVWFVSSPGDLRERWMITGDFMIYRESDFHRSQMQPHRYSTNTTCLGGDTVSSASRQMLKNKCKEITMLVWWLLIRSTTECLANQVTISKHQHRRCSGEGGGAELAGSHSTVHFTETSKSASLGVNARQRGWATPGVTWPCSKPQL